MTRPPNRPAVAVLRRKLSLDAIWPASEFVEDVERRWRPCDPFGMAAGMGKRRQIQQQGDAAAGGLSQAEGVADEQLGKA